MLNVTAVRSNWEHISYPQLHKPPPAAGLHKDNGTSFRLFVNPQTGMEKTQTTKALYGAESVAY